jgi:hypothetical protein
MLSLQYAIELNKKDMSTGRSNMHDEARETGTLNVMQRRIKRFWDFIYENRFLNMYQSLLQADYWKTPRDIVYNRAMFMVWVIEDDDWNNGIYLFYSRKNMKRLYERGKKMHDRAPKGYDFQGKFTKFWAGHPNYLDHKKQNFLNKYVKDETDKSITLYDAQRLAMERAGVRFEPKLFAQVFDCDASGVYRYAKKLTEES